MTKHKRQILNRLRDEMPVRYEGDQHCHPCNGSGILILLDLNGCTEELCPWCDGWGFVEKQIPFRKFMQSLLKERRKR